MPTPTFSFFLWLRAVHRALGFHLWAFFDSRLRQGDEMNLGVATPVVTFYDFTIFFLHLYFTIFFLHLLSVVGKIQGHRNLRDKPAMPVSQQTICTLDIRTAKSFMEERSETDGPDPR
jgi:hypothetical protein